MRLCDVKANDKEGNCMSVNFTVLIEQGEDGAFIATVPALKSCYTQADSMQELLEKIKEVIDLSIDEYNNLV
jgi:predicted RNase H-like HicB family nuclease